MWWFVFKDIEVHWTRRILKRRYQHVFAVSRMGNLTLGIDPILGQVNYLLTETPIAEMLATYKDLGFTVVSVFVESDPHRLKPRGFGMTCASYLAYTVGIPFYGVTAWQLHKKIISMGGEEL